MNQLIEKSPRTFGMPIKLFGTEVFISPKPTLFSSSLEDTQILGDSPMFGDVSWKEMKLLSPLMEGMAYNLTLFVPYSIFDGYRKLIISIMLLRKQSRILRRELSLKNLDSKKSLVRMPSSTKFPSDFFTEPKASSRNKATPSSSVLSPAHKATSIDYKEFTFMGPKLSQSVLLQSIENMVKNTPALSKKQSTPATLKRSSKLVFSRQGNRE